MHISEGVLSAPILVTGAVLSATGVYVGLRKADYDKLPQVGLFSSVFFVASLIHVPLGPAAAHLVLNGLCGLLLGWAAFPAILMGLVLQAILFQLGGLTTLGVNTFTMAFPAVIMGLLSMRFLHSSRPWVRSGVEFACGAGALLLSGLGVAGCLVANGEAFAAAALFVVIAHIPVAIVEGVLTVLIVEFIRKVRPEMLRPGRASGPGTDSLAEQ
jgi:cobalt/nickel transport system permease protein